jgi:hypothetical protein
MKMYGGSGCVDARGFLTSTLVGGEESASLSGPFISGEKAPVSHWIGGRVSPIVDVERYGEVNNLDSAGTRTPTPWSSCS